MNYPDIQIIILDIITQISLKKIQSWISGLNLNIPYSPDAPPCRIRIPSPKTWPFVMSNLPEMALIDFEMLATEVRGTSWLSCCVLLVFADSSHESCVA